MFPNPLPLFVSVFVCIYTYMCICGCARVYMFVRMSAYVVAPYAYLGLLPLRHTEVSVKFCFPLLPYCLLT